MSASDPIPIILCGKQEAIGGPVIEGLKPEYDVVQFITSPAACKEEIPHLIRGDQPASRSSELGSHSVSPRRRPVAVVLGGGYNDTVDEVRDAVEANFKAAGAMSSGVAWLRQDATKETPPVGTPAYGQASLQRVRDVLDQLKSEGKLGDGESRVLWY